MCCMNQVQFFYDEDLMTLQGQINMWLRDNRAIDVVETHFAMGGSSSNVPGVKDKAAFVFCIFYRTNSQHIMQEQVSAVQEIAGLINDSVTINMTN